MLKELQKALGLAPKAEETLEVKPEATDIQAAIAAAIEGLTAEFDGYKQTAEALLADSEAKVAELAASLVAVSAKLDEATAALEASVAEKTEMVATALAAKVAARKEKVVAALGTERADALMVATEGMEDAAFNAVLAALGAGAAVEAASEMFTESGVDAQADAAQIEESAEMKILKAKYHGQK